MKYGLDITSQEVIKAYLQLFPEESPAITINEIRLKLNSDNLKQAYRKSARRNHPDHGGVLSKMQEVNNANETLINYLKQQDNKDNFPKRQTFVSDEEKKKRQNILSQVFKNCQYEISLKYLDNLRRITNTTCLSDKIKEYFELNQISNKEICQMKKQYTEINAKILTADDETFKRSIESFSKVAYKDIKRKLKEVLVDIEKYGIDIESDIEKECKVYKNKICGISMLIVYDALNKIELSDEDKLIICEIYYDSQISSNNPIAMDIKKLNEYLAFLNSADTHFQDNIPLLKEIESTIFSKKFQNIENIENIENRKKIVNDINDAYRKLRCNLKEQIKSIMELFQFGIDFQVFIRLKNDYNKIMSNPSCESMELLTFLKSQYVVMGKYFEKGTLKNYQKAPLFSINTESNTGKKRI